MIGTPNFPRVLQFTTYTCGSCSVHAVALFYGLPVTYTEIRAALGTNKPRGTNIKRVVAYLRQLGLQASDNGPMTWPGLTGALRDGHLAFVGLDGDHCGVVHAFDGDNVYVADPSLRRQFSYRIPRRRFIERWDFDGVVIRRQ
jgi:ABC-type bacteriocin/lantibiotic exporter with double-glycine peptidase domain